MTQPKILKIFNTQSGKKEEFVPLIPGRVSMYVCGVTVYDYCHVGHARSAVAFDVIYRYLKRLGYDVNFVRNFTDIDDKIIKRANERGVPWTDITREFIDAFYEDMGRLNIEKPSNEPLATDHIHDMLAMISTLIERGHAYPADGDVFYSVRSFKDYGQLSGKNIEDLQSGARIDVNETKKDPLDFALWKKSKPGEPFWDSPWGQGRPGWHIECSAMSAKLLGETFDIHGGGKDLVFPHHENEVAQSCGATGHKPVRYWMHNGFVNIDKEKMSKSLDNFFTIREIFEKFHPETLRLFLISCQYRGPIDFSQHNLEEAEKVATRFYEALESAQALLDKRTEVNLPNLEKDIEAHSLLSGFDEAMCDDFNTAVAIAHMNEALKALNPCLQKANPDINNVRKIAVISGALRKVGNLLGLFHSSPEDFKATAFNRKKAESGIDPAKVEALILERNNARAEKNWAVADQKRDELIALGVILEDGPEGTTWKLK
ncbi:MAG: cysteine--tRNA ligase [Nitrospinae bacterium CG11_big_fil_rev_8_21_14_0_20_45_15]|nr:MAG: cysteine--tRNA ligase [Nitrospinae bacterium CG11_big_fil_rev_8_21_14_0_20_45_15]